MVPERLAQHVDAMRIGGGCLGQGIEDRPEVLGPGPLTQGLGGTADFETLRRGEPGTDDLQDGGIDGHVPGLGGVLAGQDPPLGDQSKGMDPDQGIPRIGEIAQELSALQPGLQAAQPVLQPQRGDPKGGGSIDPLPVRLSRWFPGLGHRTAEGRQRLGTEPVLDLGHRQQPPAQAG